MTHCLYVQLPKAKLERRWERALDVLQLAERSKKLDQVVLGQQRVHFE